MKTEACFCCRSFSQQRVEGARVHAGYLKGLLHGSHAISHSSSGGFVGLVVAKGRTSTALLGSQKKNRLVEWIQSQIYQHIYNINHVINKLVWLFSQKPTEESDPRPGLSL